MKTKLTILISLFAISVMGQEYGHKKCIKEKYIDLKTTYVYFHVKGLIESGGHTWNNDTAKYPVIYKADKEGIEFYIEKTNTKFKYRDCGKENCNILHLEVIKPEIIEFKQPWEWGSEIPIMPMMPFNNGIILDSLLNR